MFDVAIVGGGWAGLSAAIFATQSGKKVLLLEASPQLGGRARAVSHAGAGFDNGQHMMIGAYDTLFELLAILKCNQNTLFYRTPFFYETDDQTEAPVWPFGHSSFFASLKNSARFFKDSVFIAFHLVKKTLPLPAETTLAYLRRLNISERLISTFFAPFILASMTTPIAEADAKHFVTMLSKLKKPGATDFYFPGCDLSQLFPLPAKQWLKEKNVEIRLQERVMGISKTASHFEVYGKGTQYSAKKVILAIPSMQFKNIDFNFPDLTGLIETVSNFNQKMIQTVYLTYEKPIQNLPPLLACLKGPVDWVFNGAHFHPSSHIAGVISDVNPTRDAAVSDTLPFFLHHTYGLPEKAKTVFSVVEKRAAFACTPEVCEKRPTVETTVPGLLLAGDYVQTGLPATLESALLSGKMAAAHLFLE